MPEAGTGTLTRVGSKFGARGRAAVGRARKPSSQVKRLQGAKLLNQGGKAIKTRGPRPLSASQNTARAAARRARKAASGGQQAGNARRRTRSIIRKARLQAAAGR